MKNKVALELWFVRTSIWDAKPVDFTKLYVRAIRGKTVLAQLLIPIRIHAEN